MDEVDYLKLCDQYITFLIASAGVSITVLTLVLTFGSKSETQNKPAQNKEVDISSFLVAALIVSTVYCFIGAQMMTETAAFLSYIKNRPAKTSQSNKSDKENPTGATSDNSVSTAESPQEKQDMEFGERLFLLASTNIFITVVLLLFALMLLPTASKTVEPDSIRFISVWVFWVVVVCALFWMILAVIYRMDAEGSHLVIIIASIFIFGLVVGIVFSCFIKPIKCLLWLTFVPIGCFSAVLLLRFAWIFSDESKPKTDGVDVLGFFILPITFSYVSLGITGMRMMFPEKFVYYWIARLKTRWTLYRWRKISGS